MSPYWATEYLEQKNAGFIGDSFRAVGAGGGMLAANASRINSPVIRGPIQAMGNLIRRSSTIPTIPTELNSKLWSSIPVPQNIRQIGQAGTHAVVRTMANSILPHGVNF